MIISVNPGGTGLSAALIGARSNPLLAQTERHNWRKHPRWTATPELLTFIEIAVELVDELLSTAGFPIEDVTEVCLAWPGPGDYSIGSLSATFIPGCKDRQPVHELFASELSRAFSIPRSSLAIRSALDVSVRARGELADRAGAFHGWTGCGLTLNIGTGIAGAFVNGGRVLHQALGLGQTYGQFGRYLLHDLQTGVWSWRPTHDGSIPPYGNRVNRFTDWCGGPALARRFAQLAASEQLPATAAVARDQILEDLSRRHVQAERLLLCSIGVAAAENPSSPAGEFVQTVGTDIGSALKCLASSTGADLHRLLLTGGIGENFGSVRHAARDLLVEGVETVLPASTVIRSTLGLDAEYIGWSQVPDEREFK